MVARGSSGGDLMGLQSLTAQLSECDTELLYLLLGPAAEEESMTDAPDADGVGLGQRRIES
jgi:hypothetical protein